MYSSRQSLSQGPWQELSSLSQQLSCSTTTLGLPSCWHLDLFLDPHINLCFCFGFQLVLKIQEIFDSKRGKKKVKLLSPAGREAPPVKGTEVSSTILFATNLLSGTAPVHARVLLAGQAPPSPAAHAGLTQQC